MNRDHEKIHASDAVQQAKARYGIRDPFGRDAPSGATVADAARWTQAELASTPGLGFEGGLALSNGPSPDVGDVTEERIAAIASVIIAGAPRCECPTPSPNHRVATCERCGRVLR